MLRTEALLAFLAVAGALSAEAALACASCGSGGDDVLVLYPNEQYKTYFGLSRRGAFRTVLPDGSTGHDNGPEYKDMAVVAGGLTFAQDFFMTAGFQAVHNEAEGKHASGMGDTFVTARWTVLPQTLENPWLPQVQLLSSAKFASGKPIQEATDRRLLDAFGSGFHEFKAGADIWLAMFPIKAGVAQVFSVSLPQKYSGRLLEPGPTSRTTVTTGIGNTHAKLLIGANREARGRLKTDGEKLENSEQVNNSLFCTGSWMSTSTDELRLTLSRQAAFLKNKNTSQGNSLTLAWMHSF